MNHQQITIPERLDALLDQSASGNAVRISLQDFEQWIEGSTGGLFFFPEYTDHGPRHISAVLAATEALIRPEAWKHLTPDDSAVLVLAALLHDSAMHLTADGFLDLIDFEGNLDHQMIRPLDEKTWPEIFDEFYLEARRWDQRKLHSILGDQSKSVEDEEDLVKYIRHPREQPNPEDWSLRYRKFLGEFVRRYHARLAHEIALVGIPGSSPDRMRLTRIPDALADLAGLVARSHNMHLRDTFAYLREKYYGRVYCSKTHPIFLMVLLRIADYLEFQADRVNPTRLRIQRLRSPISQEEWNTHLAVHDVRPDEEDNEAVFIIARPPTSRTFLKIRQILSGLQAELDTSWAVLGEVFSKQGDLHQLGITLRRVRSNLDNLRQFIQAEKPPYIPTRAAFDTAGVDLLKLLIKPLYGDRPEIGVRELLQNALDAVHELHQWASDKGDPEVRSVPLPNQEAHVLISIERTGRKEYWLTITDKGIGMTVETARDYFLKAGATYRQSEIWRRHFEVEGKSRILRSGRFGVGALAAFLLGNRIEVSTRHVAAPSHEGLSFSASIEDDIIELRRHEQTYVGTTIRVKLTDQALKALRNSRVPHDWTHVDGKRRRHPWDWYVLDHPKVERFLTGKRLDQNYHVPNPASTALPSDWRLVHVDGYQGVFWTYSEAPDLTCNGIRIESYRPEKQRREQQKKLLGSVFTIIRSPSVSIFDRDGLLPLNLQRSEIETGELPFSAELLRDVLADLYAFLLAHGPQDSDSAERWILLRPKFFEPLSYHSLEIERFWMTQEGFALTHPWHIKKSALQQGLLKKFGYGNLRWKSSRTVPPSGAGLFFSSGYYGNGYLGNALKDFGITSYRELPTKQKRARAHRHERDLIQEMRDQVLTDQSPALAPDLLRSKRTHDFDLAELEFDPSKVYIKKSPLVEFFESFVDTPIIPFNLEERHRKLSRTFEFLREYIDLWRARDLKGWREEMVTQISNPLEKFSP